MTLLLVLIIIVSIALILFVLVQNPKGGGLNSEFGSAVQLGGAKRATDILEKGSWGLAIVLALLCLSVATYYKPTQNLGEETKDSRIKVENMVSDEDEGQPQQQLPPNTTTLPQE
ncbi:MAG TPA: preprotein translocase subunit SecG [Crocinitomix sp.]|nr:preprotein translocase subunit SecG [Crocinitomix sp.]